jgi:GTPase
MLSVAASAAAGMEGRGVATDHLGIALALNVPLFVVLTKVGTRQNLTPT